MKIQTTYIIYALFFLLTALISGFIIFGILYKPKPKAVNITANSSNMEERCTQNIVNCINDADCRNICLEQNQGIEMSCKDIKHTTKSQQSTYGPSQKVCVPTNAKMDCNQELGGLISYAGWGSSGIPVMEWDCLCSYPGYASTEGCKSINPDICGGPLNQTNFTWSVEKNEDPSYKYCTCPSDKKLMTMTYSGDKPICVPSSISNWYNDISK